MDIKDIKYTDNIEERVSSALEIKKIPQKFQSSSEKMEAIELGVRRNEIWFSISFARHRCGFKYSMFAQ